MPQCLGTKKNGAQCSRNVTNGTHCFQHAPAAPVPAAAVLQQFVHQPRNICQGITNRGTRCTRNAHPHFCTMHHRFPHPAVDPAIVEFWRIERYRALLARDNALKLWTLQELDTHSYQDTEHAFWVIHDQWNRLTTHNRIVLGEGGVVPIHQDAQSVHRAEVSVQTNALLDKLLGTGATFLEDKRGPIMAWLGATVNGALWHDIKKWYNTPLCKDENDWLYRRTLNAVVDYAQKHKESEEIRKRIHEEATESIGMCCEGHISRLCNALVGFHDDAAAAVAPSAKQTLQDRFAALAARGGTEEEGRAILTELAIPEPEWSAWLEAL